MQMKKGACLFASTLGLAAVVTAGFGWPEVLVGWAAAALLRWSLPRGPIRRGGRLSGGITAVGSVLIVCGALLAAEAAFPEEGTFPFVSLGMLYLFYRTVTGRAGAGVRAGNVLGLALCGLMGVLLVFGFTDIAWEETLPEGFSWKNSMVALALAGPWWCSREQRDHDWGWFIAGAGGAVALSLMVRGLLGMELTGQMPLPLFHAVETIKIMGSLQHFSALLAAAVLMGVYCLMAWTGEIMDSAVNALVPPGKKKLWAGAAAVIVFLLESGYGMLNSGVQEAVSTAFWGFVLLFALWVVIFGNFRNSENNA